MLPQPKGEYKLPFIAKTSMGTSSSLKIAWWTEIFRTPYEPQYLYLVSDQKLEVNDIVISTYDNWKGDSPLKPQIGKILEIGEDYYLIDAFNGVEDNKWDIGYSKKIVATNDKSLGLPLIPQSFVDKFIEKKGGIEEVMIDTEITHEGSGTYSMDINDIALSGLIPIRVAVTRPDDTVIISKVKTNWNKEELFLVLYECLGDFAHKHNITISGQDITNWADEKL